jgi:hypothetical protein
METQLAFATDASFLKAKAIYSKGAFSKSTASVTLSTALTGPLLKSAKVTGKSADGTDINGSMLEDVEAGTKVIKVQYDTTTLQASYVGCQVGANPAPVTEGCK